MQAAIMTDTEAETTMELDGDEPMQINRETANFTKSVFNITFENLLEQQDSVEVKDYELRLIQEMKEWEAIWRNSFQQAKKANEQYPPVNLSMLAPEKRAYLGKMPNLQNFIRESIELRQEAYLYLEKDFSEILEIRQNLESVCEDISDTAKNAIILKHLANKMDKNNSN